MGFDQYHEPPAELPGETRTFARLCASLTEEAEAIGWYEQRMAVEALLQAGVDGPYGLALGPAAYTRVLETSEHGGYPLLDHLRKIVGGPLVWAPGVDGAVVVSQRGGDFLLDVGQDLSVGYTSHDADAVELYLEESLTFRVATAEAAVALSP